MSFLNPLALFGLGLLALPVLVHIFKPRRVRQMPFSSLRWLRASQHRMSRRIRWHQILLFLLRAAFLILLVLALARPTISTGGNDGPTARFIIVDVSRSMGYQPTDGEPPLTRAKRIAQDMLNRGGAGDRTTVILAGARAEVLGPLVADPGVYVAPMSARAAQSGRASLDSVLQAARGLLRDVPADMPAELVFITDNQRGNWKPAAIERSRARLERPLRVRVIDVAEPTAENVWIAEARLLDNNRIRVTVGADAAEQRQRLVRLAQVPDQPPQQEKVTVRPGELTPVYFDVGAAADLSGSDERAIARLTLDPTDALPSDDRYWVNLNSPGTTRLLLLEHPASVEARRGASLHLRTALSAISETTGATLRIERRAATSATVQDIREADVVWLVEAPRLEPAVVEALRRRVRDGGGLAIFPGPGIERDFYNNQLHGSGDASALLPVKLNEAQPAPDGMARLQDVARQHPLFDGLFDPIYGDLARARFYQYYALQRAEQPGARALVRFDDGTAALVSHDVGAGRVLFVNTTADDGWSDLARRGAFLPLVDRMLSHLAGGMGRGSFEVGEPVRVPLPAAAMDAAVTVIAPDGSAQQMPLSRMAGRPVLQMQPRGRAGVYRVQYTTAQGQQRDTAFVIQADRADSVLDPIDAETLKQWWAPTPVSLTRVGPRDDAAVAGARRYALAPWLVLLACLVMLAEMWFVHTMCPAVNPTVAQSFVHRHGLVRGTTPSDGDAAAGGDGNGDGEDEGARAAAAPGESNEQMQEERVAS